jgi:hypothetical protein
MNRRRALRIAGTVSAATLGGSLALGANFGLLGFARSDAPSLGLLEATRASAEQAPTTPKVVTVYEDIFVPAPTAPPSGGSAPAPPAVATGVAGDRRDDGSTTSSSVGLHVEDDDDHGEDEGVEDTEDHFEDEDHEADDVTEGLRDDD